MFPFPYDNETISVCITPDGALEVCCDGTQNINTYNNDVMNFSPCVLQSWILMGKSSLALENGVTVVLTVLKRKMSGLLMTL